MTAPGPRMVNHAYDDCVLFHTIHGFYFIRLIGQIRFSSQHDHAPALDTTTILEKACSTTHIRMYLAMALRTFVPPFMKGGEGGISPAAMPPPSPLSKRVKTWGQVLSCVSLIPKRKVVCCCTRSIIGLSLHKFSLDYCTFVHYISASEVARQWLSCPFTP